MRLGSSSFSPRDDQRLQLTPVESSIRTLFYVLLLNFRGVFVPFRNHREHGLMSCQLLISLSSKMKRLLPDVNPKTSALCQVSELCSSSLLKRVGSWTKITSVHIPGVLFGPSTWSQAHVPAGSLRDPLFFFGIFPLWSFPIC